MVEQRFNAPARVFTKAIQGLLRPLVRAMIAQGITAPAFYRMIKQIYVDVAEEAFSLGEDRPTDSRISLLTGVHRRDVRAFRNADDEDGDDTVEKLTTIASVLGRWLADPAYTGFDGRPVPLSRSEKSEPSFETLVQSISRDIRPRTVLDELLRQNLVDMKEQESLIELRHDAFVGAGDAEQKIFFFAENIGDHMAAAVDNLLRDQPQFLERAVFYNRLRAASVDEIEAHARERAMDLLVDLNRMANTHQSTDKLEEDGTERFRFGVFFYRDDEADQEAGQPDPEVDKSDEDN